MICARRSCGGNQLVGDAAKRRHHYHHRFVATFDNGFHVAQAFYRAYRRAAKFHYFHWLMSSKIY